MEQKDETPQTHAGLDALVIVKLAHTAIWALFAGCILAMPVMSWRGEHTVALILAGIVAVEVLILLVNQWSCPLTSVAARYTDDRRPNFDIYLPAWLARNNKLIFGTLYVAGLVFVLLRLWQAQP